MSRMHLIAVILSLGVGVTGQPTRADSPSILLEKGIHLEETVGDLDKAIEVYQEIITNAEANRRYIAQAQFRLGECYLKQKQEPQAAAAFQAVIDKFPDQTDLVAKARKRIPGPIFPDLAGCRLKERIELPLFSATGDPKSAHHSPVRSVYEHTLIDLHWNLDDKDADMNGVIRVRVDASASDSSPSTQPAGFGLELPMKQRSVVLQSPDPETLIDLEGQPKSQKDRKPLHLRPGHYIITLQALGEKTAGIRAVRAEGTVSLTIKPLVYTQVSVNDVQPDGTIRLQSFTQWINTSDQPLAARRFRNSDFVRITGMSDDQGRPLKFTETHVGNSFHYSVSLHDPVAPGDTVFLATQGTETGLIKATSEKRDEFRYHMKHWPSANQPTRRVEVYRLPAGAELIDTIPVDMARRTQNGRIELFVEKIIPSGGYIVTSFTYRLPGAELATETPMQLKPAPWVDGEVLTLKLSTPIGANIGTIIYSAESKTRDGKDIWRIDSRMFIKAANMEQFTRVDAAKDSFAPIFGWTKNNMMGDFQAEYSDKAIKHTTRGATSDTTRNIEISKVLYDNEQALYVIRRMPLTKGYQSRFPIFPVQSGMTQAKVQIRVLDQEQVSTPAGRFDCYKVDLAVYFADEQALLHQVWFSADQHRYLVKYDSKSALMELTSITTLKELEGQPTEDSDGQVSVRLPAGWFAYQHDRPSPYRLMLQLIPPEMNAWCLLTSAGRGGDEASIRSTAEGDVEVLKGYFQDYTVRADSWTDMHWADLPAARYIADYKEGGVEKVEYRTYILGKSAIYWFVFRIEKDQFAANKRVFDTIMKSFRPGHSKGK